MQTIKFKIEQKDSGTRIDQFLTKSLPGKSRSFIQKLISEGCILLNNSPTKSHHKLKPQDEITVQMPEPQHLELVPQNIPLDIKYEDEHIIVVNKPQGMVVHPAAGNLNATLVNALLYHCGGRLAACGAPLRPGIVHRLDKDVSGLLVVAKTDEAYHQLVRQFKEKAIKRKYIAFVKGIVQFDEGIVDLPVGRHPIHRKKMAVTYSTGKSAKTHYKVLKRFKDYTMLELTLATGRTHQIRVHMAYLGHPILGDPLYGITAKLGRLALHATTLGFTHPVSGQNLEFESKLPQGIEFLTKE